MIELYDYQKEYVKSLRENIRQGNKRLILAAPTGSGKTVMFSYITNQAIKKGSSVLVFTHRSELLEQAGGAFNEFGLSPEYIEAGKQPDLDKKLHVAMVETFHRRIKSYTDFLQSRDVIIFDEAHLQNFNKILDHTSPKQVIIGATATPIRKGKERCLSENYDKVVQVIDTPDLIKKKKLVPAKSYGVKIDMKGLKRKGKDYDTEIFYNENETYKGVVQNCNKYAKGKKTIVFTSSIKSSKQVKDEFIKNGIEAKHVDGSTKNRSDIFDWFDKKPNAVLCNCGIATTGFDQKDIECVILYRATTSLALFLQMCGRGSRTYSGKKNFTILDFGNNIRRHGFWQARRQWKLEKQKKKSNKEAEAAVKECPKCLAINYASIKFCIECNHEFKTKEEKKKEVILEELKEHAIIGRNVDDLSINELIQCQDRNVLKSAFVWRIIRSRGGEQVANYAKLKGYSPGWIKRQLVLISEGDVTYKNVTIHEDRI